MRTCDQCHKTFYSSLTTLSIYLARKEILNPVMRKGIREMPIKWTIKVGDPYVNL